MSVTPQAGEVRTGDPITISWKAAPGLDLACRTPLYLVLTTPMRTRFEGEKFLAIPPKAEAPYGIQYRAERTRVFVPLHLGPRQYEGEALIKVYEAGPLSLDWALVEVPKLGDDPQTRKDFAVGRERATAAAALGPQVTVIGGNPAIVVRDQFATETPKRVIHSNSGEFNLQVFESFYRVLDAKTGELLQERTGWDPNFSPTSRFLGAYSAGAGFEIIDLYSGRVATSNDILHRERGFRGNVHMAAWSRGDAVFALSIQGWGGIEVQQSLVDGSQRSFPDTSCHHCRGIGSALRISSEAGIASFQGQQIGWASLLDRAIGTAAATKQSFTQFPRQSWETNGAEQPTQQQQKILERRVELAQQLASTMVADLARNSFFKPDDFLTGFDTDKAAEHVEGNWQFPDAMRLSHLCLEGNDGKCVGRLVDFQQALTDPEDEQVRLLKMRITHNELAALNASDSGMQQADARLITVRGAGQRAGRRGSETLASSSTVWDRLAQLLLNVKDGAALQPISQGDDAKSATQEGDNVIAPIVRAISKASAVFRASNKKDYIDLEDISVDAYYGLKNEAKLIDPRTIRQLASWRVGDQSYWLIHSFFDNGASSRNWLFLLHGTKDRPSTLVDLTHRLRYRVGRNPSGLDDHGQIEMTEEYATTVGFGGWPSSFDRVSVAFDRYLIATGVWTIDARRWVLIYDLQTNQIRFFNRDVAEAATVAQLAITNDGRTLLQTNSNGHLFFYDVASEKLVLRGFEIDDELVVYDPRGYYVASPEGAQFVYLKFPGLPGYNSFQQFAGTLNRPDLVKAVLGGKVETPDPLLTAPPKLGLEVDIAGTGAGRSTKLALTAASSVGLDKVRVFIDGRLEGEHPVTGGVGTREVTVSTSARSALGHGGRRRHEGLPECAPGSEPRGRRPCNHQPAFCHRGRDRSLRRQGQYSTAGGCEGGCAEFREQFDGIEGRRLRQRRGGLVSRCGGIARKPAGQDPRGRGESRRPRYHHVVCGRTWLPRRIDGSVLPRYAREPHRQSAGNLDRLGGDCNGARRRQGARHRLPGRLPFGCSRRRWHERRRGLDPPERKDVYHRDCRRQGAPGKSGIRQRRGLYDGTRQGIHR